PIVRGGRWRVDVSSFGCCRTVTPSRESAIHPPRGAGQNRRGSPDGSRAAHRLTARPREWGHLLPTPAADPPGSATINAPRAKATTGPHPGPLPGSHRTAVALPTPSHHPGPARSALRCPLKHRQLFGATRPQRRAPGSGYSLVSPLGAPVIAVSIETE